jgi:hypothetical protein
MTGRAAGYCAGYPVPGFMNPIPGRGFFGFGRRGGGRGRRNWFNATGVPGWQRAAYGYPAFGGVPYGGVPFGAPPMPTVTREQEVEVLKGQADYFANALEDIKKRIEELESQKTDR